jgi:hypothetical protein
MLVLWKLGVFGFAILFVHKHTIGKAREDIGT